MRVLYVGAVERSVLAGLWNARNKRHIPSILHLSFSARYSKLKPLVPYRFLLSLPERVVRSLSALTGGLLEEAGVILLPARVRRTALYRVIVGVALRFLVEEVGRVEGIYAPEGRLEDFLLKRGASHSIELLGLLTLHVSPIWVLAALADATGAGHALIQQIAQSLKDEGLLDKDSKFESLDQLLDGLEKTSGHLADLLNVPPVRLTELRREWTRLKAEMPALPAESLPTLANLERVWVKLVREADRQQRSVFMLCSTLAIAAVAEIPSNVLWLSRAAGTAAKRTGQMVGDTLIAHYLHSLDEISSRGFVAYWRAQFKPYLHAAAEQFAPSTLSTTERLLTRKNL